MSEPAPLRPGTEVAPGYRLIAHLNRSRLLDVHDAWSDARGCRCVVKVLRPDFADDRAARRRLVAEGRLLLRLSHPHIVRGYAAGDGPRPFAAMETLSGQTLAHLVENARRPLSAVELGHLGLQLGSALRYLHSHGLLHLDLKPSNVIAEGGRAKLIDLSIARRPGRSRGGAGTWCYMAPEQISGGELTAAADVWGLGATLYEAAAGEAPFHAAGDELESFSTDSETTASSPDARDREPSPSIRARRRLPTLAGLIERCLSEEPGERPDIETVLAELERATELPRAEWRWNAGPAGQIARSPGRGG